MNWFMQEKANGLMGMFFKHPERLEDVRPGSTFRRVHADNMIETAKVVSIAADAHGIPHVKFQVSFARPFRGASSEETSRMLALRTFANIYKEQVPA